VHTADAARCGAAARCSCTTCGMMGAVVQLHVAVRMPLSMLCACYTPALTRLLRTQLALHTAASSRAYTASHAAAHSTPAMHGLRLHTAGILCA